MERIGRNFEGGQEGGEDLRFSKVSGGADWNFECVVRGGREFRRGLRVLGGVSKVRCGAGARMAVCFKFDKDAPVVYIVVRAAVGDDRMGHRHYVPTCDRERPEHGWSFFLPHKL